MGSLEQPQGGPKDLNKLTRFHYHQLHLPSELLVVSRNDGNWKVDRQMEELVKELPNMKTPECMFRRNFENRVSVFSRKPTHGSSVSVLRQTHVVCSQCDPVFREETPEITFLDSTWRPFMLRWPGELLFCSSYMAT